MASKASDRRYAGIGRVIRFALIPTEQAIRDGIGDHNDHGLRTTDAEAIACQIETLEGLGRTMRWQAQVHAWASMVRDEDTPQGIRWAVLQGAVYAGHAAV